MIRLELLQLSILDSGSQLDSMVGYDSVTRSLADYESMVGFDFASSAGFALGTLASSESAHSVTGECFHPSTLQSTKGNFQHYARWPHSMYTMHEDTSSDSA